MSITSINQLPNKIKEMVLAELRSVRAIQTDYSNVVYDIQKHLELYKKSKGTPEEKKHIEHLKSLNDKKKKLSAELNDKVSDMYKDAELKVDEMSTSDAAGPYNTPFAFGKGEDEKKKGKRQADLTGYTVVKESFIPNVGNIDNFKLKSLLLKNPKVKQILGDDEYKFLSNDKTDVIMVSGKPFNTITTDGKLEFELDLKAQKLVKPLGKARPKIASYYSNLNEEAPAKTEKELADSVLRLYDFATDYIDDGGQRRRAIKNNEDVLKWFDSHPSDVKQKALKVMLSKQPSIKSKIERVFGSSI